MKKADKYPQINIATPQTWAEGLLRKVQHVTEHGFGDCYDGTPATAKDFLCDTHGGDFPYNEEKGRAVEAAMRAHPEHDVIMAAFEAKFGVDFWGDE